MKEKIRGKLYDLSEEKYRDFSSNLLPGTDNILGVRLPNLRKIAKDISKLNWRDYLKDMSNEEDKFFEEIMIEGMVIGYSDCHLEERLSYIRTFIPKIANWSICDSFCSTLKFTEKNLEEVWFFIRPYFFSDREFDVRFAVVMTLSYYIDKEYIDEIFNIFDRIDSRGYYAKMGLAWALSVCYIKMPNRTLEYIEDNSLDKFTHNKSIQKIIESKRVDSETKDMLRAKKRK